MLDARRDIFDLFVEAQGFGHPRAVSLEHGVSVSFGAGVVYQKRALPSLQMRVLVELDRDGRGRISRAGCRAGLGTSNIRRIRDSLERRGLIEVLRQPAGRSRVLAQITSRGRALLVADPRSSQK